jgi:ABC-type lipoprotein export system ATPase subunit
VLLRRGVNAVFDAPCFLLPFPRMSSPLTNGSPASDTAADEAASLVHFADVTKAYTMGRTRVRALDDVTLTIPQGQFVAVVGPSGSGKSTLLHLLAAMDRPTEGTIQVGDWDVGGLSQKEQSRYRRTMVGMIFQQFHLVPTMTALENVALPMILAGEPPDARTERAAECLAMVGLADRLDHRPTELSGGEQQRVATARALVGDPPLLLADEPTGNLDSETGAQIVDLLSTVHREQGRTVIVVTHHPEELNGIAERSLRLQDGALVDG